MKVSHLYMVMQIRYSAFRTGHFPWHFGGPYLQRSFWIRFFLFHPACRRNTAFQQGHTGDGSRLFCPAFRFYPVVT